tara:strand:+ start:38 stop:901 length:864 start_codon:yes stop_codon:yes gene_type:complete
MGDLYYDSDGIDELLEATVAISGAVVEFVSNVGNGFSTLVPYTNDSDEYQIGRIDFKSMFDEKIVNICQKMFNAEKCRPHHYNQMNDFLNTCIILTNEILDLITTLNNLINEDSNDFCNHGLVNTIQSSFKAFKYNCEKIDFFHKKKYNRRINEYLLNDLYEALNDYIKSTYYEIDFENTETIYSNIQITWTFIRYNLLNYQKMKNNEYQRIMFPSQNRLEYSEGWGLKKAIANFFFPSVEGTVTIRQEPQLPLIENRIVWKGNEVNFNNRIKNNVNINNIRLITAN